MKKREKYCIHNFCESCTHIMEERGLIYEGCEYECCKLTNDCFLEHGDKCVICGQNLIDSPEVESFAKDLQLLDSALNNKNIKVVCYTAPSVRIAIGDEFGMNAGENVQGRMVSALKRLGFNQVFDMNLAADFTIVEEAEEFRQRLITGKRLPMFTSCCPGWVNYCTKLYPEYVENLSTCKSPQQMFGALINSYYAERNGLKSTDMFVVSVVPCLAKKMELKQANMNVNEGYDVDLAITTKELAQIIKQRGIDFINLPESEYDDFFGVASGAGAIFGNTGGVMEAVLRTVNDRMTNSEQKEIDYLMVRGIDGVRRAEIKIGNRLVKIAVVTGLKNINIVLDELKENPEKYDLIEVMACEGGCVGGPGQPRRVNENVRDVIRERIKGLYDSELKKQHRKAHKNPAVIKVYDEFLGDVGGKKAKKLLHRVYN